MSTNKDEPSRDSINLELLKCKLAEARDLLPRYLQTFTIYVAIHGGLLKFALDVNATPELRVGLSILGIILVFMGALVSLRWGHEMRRSLQRDIASLCERLGVERMESDGLSLRYTAMGVSVFNVLALVGWLFVIFWRK